MQKFISSPENELKWKEEDWEWHPYKMEAMHVQYSNNNNGSSNNNTSTGGGKGRRRVFRWPLVCQVEGCNADLSSLKEYHQRYKICEYHLKINHIIKDGEKHRFCQQCGRFHILSEFDGVKRSCRTRLERHNERRRKKVAANKRRKLTPYSYGDMNIYKNEIDYSDPFPPAISSGCIKTEMYNIQDPFQKNVNFSSRATDACDDEAIAEVFTHYAQSSEAFELWQALQSSKCNGGAPSSDSRTQNLRSLDYRQSNNMCNNSSSNNNNNNDSCLDMMLDKAAQSSLMQKSPILTRNCCMAMGSPSQPLQSCCCSPCSDTFETSFNYNDNSLNFKSHNSITSATAVATSTPLYLSSIAPKVEEIHHQDMDISYSSGIFPNEILTAEEPDRAAALYDSLLKLTSLSVKVFNCTPANLPPSLRRELLGAVRSGLVPEGYMRPGCVLLTLDIWKYQRETELPKIESIVYKLLNGEYSNFWNSHNIIVQYEGEVAVLSEGIVVHKEFECCNPRVFTQLDICGPPCILNKAGSRFYITGPSDTVELSCRIDGSIPMIKKEKMTNGIFECTVSDDLPSFGLIKVDSTENGITSSFQTVLVVNDTEILEELSHLRNFTYDVRDIISDFGLVFKYYDQILLGANISASLLCATATIVYGEEEIKAILLTAQKLFCLSISQDWACTAHLLALAIDNCCTRLGTSLHSATIEGVRKERPRHRLAIEERVRLFSTSAERAGTLVMTE